ncbi:MAG: hypothetical protein AAF750_14650 [Planctomycetota bacterium]
MHNKRTSAAWLTPAWVVLACLTVTVGCSGDRDDDNDRSSDASPDNADFTGQFTGSFPVQGQTIPIQLELKQDGETVTGQYHAIYPFTVDAKTTDDDSIAGTLTHPQLKYQFTGGLTDTGIQLTTQPTQPTPGVPAQFTINLTRQDTTQTHLQDADPPNTTENPALDPRLVGVWKCVATSGRRPLRPGIKTPRPTTEMVSQINADGTFAFQSTVIQTHLPTNPTPSPVVTGKWKAENNTLYTQTAGSPHWTPLGTYRFDGTANAMTITAGGNPQLWERVR